MSRDQGIKQDEGKPRWELVPMKALEGIPKVMQDAIEPTKEHPEGRYEIHSWQKVDPLRYFGAMMRHIVDLQTGEELTRDTLQEHIDAILTNAMFLSYFLKTGYDCRGLIPLHSECKEEKPEEEVDNCIDCMEACSPFCHHYPTEMMNVIQEGFSYEC
jgi:hypothetical protein